jgi:dihydrofolate reductase
MGSRTFQDMKAHWPTSTEPLASLMNEIPKVVFSKRRTAAKESAAQTTTALDDATRAKAAQGIVPSSTLSPHTDTWANAQVASGDLVADIERLRHLPGKDILAHGGAGFAQSLVQQDLIDEYRLLMHPTVLGKGLALFAKLPDMKRLNLSAQPLFLPAQSRMSTCGRECSRSSQLRCSWSPLMWNVRPLTT